MSVSFDTLYREYENTNNVCAFCEKYSENDTATRFLLIRSLDKTNLQDIIAVYSAEKASGRIENLTRQAYLSPVTIPQLLDYIESQRSAVLKKREEELDGISDILADFPVVNCGVRNDKVDNIVKGIVRDKSIKTIHELEKTIDTSALPRIRQYMLWSYYNQNAKDIIELFFLRHPKVIPTLRKIHDIDFFIKVGNKIIPFDLKFTHISDEYFDLFSKGMIDCSNNPSVYDNYQVHEADSELQQIKNFYSSYKKDWDLPNYGGLSKTELLDTLSETMQKEALDFIRNITLKRKSYVSATAKNLLPLEWWNYKYQGERLFCNNNRFFVFLAYKDQFIDGRPLKGKSKQIGQKINQLLDYITEDQLHTIQYHYTKEANLTGDYSALSVSTIYTE